MLEILSRSGWIHPPIKNIQHHSPIGSWHMGLPTGTSGRMFHFRDFSVLVNIVCYSAGMCRCTGAHRELTTVCAKRVHRDRRERRERACREREERVQRGRREGEEKEERGERAQREHCSRRWVLSKISSSENLYWGSAALWEGQYWGSAVVSDSQDHFSDPRILVWW